jgi:pimeloyl-ACP methyl ester carboxylesterase
MPTVDNHGVKIYYERHGQGPPLVLTYCLGGNHTMWRDQIPVLSQLYELILWDPRGHGGSDSPPDAEQYGVQTSADDLKRLLDHLAFDSAYVGGVSMGGGIAARFAASYPERVAALMICDSNTASGIPPSEQMRTIREATIALCEAGDMEAVAAYYLTENPSYHLVAGDTPEGRARLRQMMLQLNPVGFANTLRAMLVSDFPTERLALISAPTLLLAGAQDPAMAAIRTTQTHIPDATLKIIANAGHLSNLDQPEVFANQILEFLQHVRG